MDITTLPEQMPTSWVDQIKKAIKPSKVGMVLGSSVIAALVSFGANYAMEIRKARVELAKMHAIDARQSLQTLANHLVTLDLRLDNLATTSELLQRSASKPTLSGYAKKSVDHVSEQMTLVYASAKDPRIGSGIAGHVTEVLDTLAPRLAQAQSDLKAFGTLADLYKGDLQPRIQGIQGEIEIAIRQTEP